MSEDDKRELNIYYEGGRMFLDKKDALKNGLDIFNKALKNKAKVTLICRSFIQTHGTFKPD
jgi:hypothetical protein